MTIRVLGRLLGFCAVLALPGATPLIAQTPAAQTGAAAPVANSRDVATVDAILHALYEVISGDAGIARDWDRFRSLFAPGARLIPVGPRQGGGFGNRVLTPEEYIERSGPLLVGNGFHEREIARRSESYGQIVHAFSTYESRQKASDREPFARGINSIQLFNDGTRWWIQTVMWWGETPATPLPQRYLESGIR
jgi:hypothetical protein